jgi:protein TonB
LPAATPAKAVAAPPAVAAAPVIDTAPDYKAAYLNNPRPAYPMAARRMGWEGRVVLNVEVLAEGSCGDASVFQSSGHEVLDNAALRTVKGWRFVPASRAGRPVTQWFKVPIQFSLKENEA